MIILYANVVCNCDHPMVLSFDTVCYLTVMYISKTIVRGNMSHKIVGLFLNRESDCRDLVLTFHYILYDIKMYSTVNLVFL